MAVPSLESVMTATRGNRERHHPPAGPDRSDDHARVLRAGKKGSSPRKQPQERETPTRDKGRDDHRSGSDSNRH
jgi:hypothetical protein